MIGDVTASFGAMLLDDWMLFPRFDLSMYFIFNVAVFIILA
jgi:hypothetical protein